MKNDLPIADGVFKVDPGWGRQGFTPYLLAFSLPPRDDLRNTYEFANAPAHRGSPEGAGDGVESLQSSE